MLIISLGLFVQYSPAQQVSSILGTNTLQQDWPQLKVPRVSPFGNYISYRVLGSHSGKVSLVIQSKDGQWKKEYPGVSISYFTADEKKFVFIKKDSLYFLVPGKDAPEYVKKVKFHAASADRDIKWMAYQPTFEDSLVVENMLTNNKQYLSRSSYCVFAPGTDILLSVSVPDKGDTIKKMILTDPNIGKRWTIWRGPANDQISNFNFDKRGMALTFTLQELIDGNKITSIWYYHSGDNQAKCLIRDGDPRIPSGSYISGNAKLSGNGRWVFLDIINAAITPIKPKPDGIQLDVWSYKDEYLQPEQRFRNSRPDLSANALIAVLPVVGRSFSLIGQRNEQMIGDPGLILGDQTVIRVHDLNAKKDPNYREFNYYGYSIYIVSLSDGSRKLISKDAVGKVLACFSPDQRYLVYYDSRQRNYFSYATTSGILLNITQSIPGIYADKHMSKLYGSVASSPGWLSRDSPRILIYDNYDLWAVDPSCRQKPVNLTRSYGRLHHVKLRLADVDELSSTNSRIYARGDTLLLTGVDTRNEFNGFFRLVLGNKEKLVPLYMGPYIFCRGHSQNNYEEAYLGEKPVKASRANCWLISRQSAEEAPNYFLTDDFKKFRQATKVAPNKAYNWLTSELVIYKQLDGNPCKGILYKPEDFDPEKSYPVIFNFYQSRSQEMYLFHYPELIANNIDIPYFVSRGYLVFVPDIHYTIAAESGRTYGDAACNSVLAAAEYLSKLPYVDSGHMALQGHSFGAAEVNYLLTRTNLFAAAEEASGDADPISSYFTLIGSVGSYGYPDRDITSNQFEFERAQSRLGATPWARPDLYAKLSVVLHANHITTPLMIVHNKLDGNVQWRQGVELYMALRRLEKPAWMLQYDGQEHSLFDPADEKDLTIRMTEYFDHYLKGYPPPVWMTKGVPAAMKGIEAGYALDLQGECGPDCLVCRKKNYRNYYKLLKEHPEQVKF